MNRGRGPRRLWRRPSVFVAALLLFAAGLTSVGVTFASFTAETQNNTSTLAGGWLSPPTGLSVTPSGYSGVLAWSPGKHGLDGQQLYGVDNGVSSTCPSSLSSYTSLASMTSATTAGYTDSSTTLESGNPRSTVNGHYVCYQMVSTRSNSGWIAAASFPATVLGLVPTGVSSTSASPITGGSSTITITFNQNVTVPTGTSIDVCLLPSSNQIVLGNSTSCTATIGTISVPSTNGSKENDCTGSGVQANNNSIVISLPNCKGGSGNAVSFAGAATYTPAAGGAIVASSVGAVPQCTTSLCVATGTFS